jgi:hypothetical protein
MLDERNIPIISALIPIAYGAGHPQRRAMSTYAVFGVGMEAIVPAGSIQFTGFAPLYE